MSKVVVQVSGGLDSTIVLAEALHTYGHDNVFPITFDDDSCIWRVKDSIAVHRVVKRYMIQDKLFVCRIIQTDTLEMFDMTDPHPISFIPGYKMLLNLSSLAWAHRIGADTVLIGNIKSENIHSDELMDGIRKSSHLYNSIYGTAINFAAPLLNMSRKAIIELGISLGVDLAETHSCDNDSLAGAVNCGKCHSCLKRKKKFQEAGVQDPTVYLFNH